MQSKIKVIIPDNNNAERAYIINILFHEFLGLEYELHAENDATAYIIILNNGSRLIIEDSFFYHYPEPLSYLSYKSIPALVVNANNEFLIVDNLPVIYGNTGLRVSKNEIVCGIDIFASSFYMLTRWEEYIIKERDIHGRFSAHNSLAFKFGFLDRAVVNEYTELLWNLIYYLDSTHKKKTHTFEIIPTHDVDSISCWHNTAKDMKRIIAYFLKRKKVKYGIANLVSYIKTLVNKENDPYNTFKFLLDYSDSLGLKSYFFFMSSAEYSSLEQERMKKIASTILQRGHFVGFHPNKNTCSDKSTFQNELNELNDILGRKHVIGRQHLLQFEIPSTWKIWDDCGMKWDSSLVYFDKIGFRCGVCYPYSTFDVIEREQLNLKELPLLAMDCTMFGYNFMNAGEALAQLKRLKDVIKTHNGKFVILWHNSYVSFENAKTLEVYKSILKPS